MAFSPPIQALLFDLGGVVLEIDFDRALRHWAADSALPLAELRHAFSFDSAYQRHERGEIEATEYFQHLRTALALTASDAQIEAGWNALLVGEISGALTLVEKARNRLPCYALTNANRSHQLAWQATWPRVDAAFDRIFASWQMGCRKPERAAFQTVCEAIGVAPSAVLFFDDTLVNVEGAIEAGLQAVHVRSTDDVRAALQGLL